MANATEEDQARGEAHVRQQIETASADLTSLKEISEKNRTPAQKKKIEQLEQKISELQQRLRNY